LAVANKYQGEPIVFIAINSGNSISDVAAYLNKNNINWPTIVDSARLFEQEVGVGEVSLDNIMCYRVRNADGTVTPLGNLADSATQAMRTAQWNVDPTSIPDSLKECWMAVEFGDFASASRTLQRSLKSKKPEIQTAAETLNEFVQGKLAAMLEVATTAKSEGDDWLAFKTFQEFQVRFKGYDVETDVDAELETLASSEAVKAQIAAAKQLTSAMKQLNRSGLQRVAKRLEKLVEKYPGSEAAEQAQALLDTVEE